jgi:tetratricopeptide (TPR) repeat protein
VTAPIDPSPSGHAEEDTSSLLHVPDGGQLVAHVLELAAREAAALRSAGADDRVADLDVRAALARWDALRQPAEALRLLAAADRHPLALRLQIMAALDDADQLAALGEAALGPLGIELAEALLWRHGDAARAARLADRLLDGEPEPASDPPPRDNQTTGVVRAVPSATSAFDAAPTRPLDAPPTSRAFDAVPPANDAFGAILTRTIADPRLPPIPAPRPADPGRFDGESTTSTAARRFEADDATATAARRLAHRFDEPTTARGPRWPDGALATAQRHQLLELASIAHVATASWPRVIELRSRAIGEGAAPDEVAATAALLRDRAGDAKAALELCWTQLAHFPGRDAQALGWLRCLDVALDAALELADPRRFELLDQRAELIATLPRGDAEAIATRLAIAGELDQHEPDAAAMWAELGELAAPPATLRRHAHLRAAWAAVRQPDSLAAQLAARRRLADAECTEVAAAHAWRALELATLSDDEAVPELARAVAEAGATPAAERWLDALELAAPTPATVLRLEARPRLRWAAAVAERRGEPDRATALWQRVTGDPTAHDHLARLQRGRDDDALAVAYHAWARAERDPRCAAALWCARGVVDLARGDFIEAEESLQRAAQLGPDDAFCRAALAAVYRAGKRHDALATVLADLSTLLADPAGRAAASREYAELLDLHLGDPAAARAALERMIGERPDDGDTMLVLARLCERDQLWGRAIELRRRAAELVPDARRAEIWAEVARNEEARGDRDAALAAYVRAADAGHPDAADHQARLLHQAGRLEPALAIVRAQLALDPPLARRMQLQKHLAQLLYELDREPETIVAAYLDVLSIEPDQTEALHGIERPARALGLWDELARAFRGAPQTARNLEVLAEALARIAEWAELAEVRRRQLETATTNVDKAQRAAELARLYEHELGDGDAAVRMLILAQQSLYDDARQPELVRLLRETSRWPELVAALERELPTVRAADVDRQVAILLELGALRAEKLAKPADAVLAYESVLTRRPGDPTATAALEQLYGQLGKDRELARLLETRAEAEAGAPRAQLLGRVAQLRAQRGDVDGAIAAYTTAFATDPANREVFTALERVCYKAERWAAAMHLYDVAIAHVESGASRAYRLGDLYARRGNVQLNFLGQTDAAIASLQKVIEVDSAPTAAVKTLEDLCRRRDDWQPLIAAYERRAETQRDDAKKLEALRAAATVVRDHAPDPRASVRLHKKVLDVDPQDASAAASLERYYEDNQDKSGLIDVLKVRLQRTEGQASVDLLRRIARVSEDGARDVETATEHYQKMLELQPENRDALEALGRIYESTEQWAELIDITRKQIKVTSDRATKALLFFRCGSVMEAKFGREQDAIRYYDAAIKTSAACLPAIHGLRDLHRRREEWPLVIETLELEVKVWQDDKERAGVFAQIGRIYDHQLGDGERAMHYYESALSVDPDCLPANQAVFEHFFAAGDWDKAQPLAAALAQKAMRDGDPSTRSDFYRKRGVVARMTGDPRAAAESFIVALEIKPLYPDALTELGALARERPDVWDFDATYRELEKVYKRRDDAGPLLARVHVGRAAIRERDGDLDAAAQLYHQALELAPGDVVVLSALVDFHADMRQWPEAIAAIKTFVASGAASPPDRVAALMRQAEIHGDGELDTGRAIAVLREVLELDPTHQDGYYAIAQQYYLSGRYHDARVAIDRVIELATAPGQALIPAALARYYYYKGRILDAAGDLRAAAPQYRRAIEYDPGYAPPALVLARRAADAGDQRQAETLLIDAAHAAMAQGGPRAAVPLQRGLARILLASGDRPAAIEAYRGILNVEPDGASDRVALAEIYAVDDPPRAIGELRKVLERDIHHAPAYRLLASFYSRTGDTERANRVLTALDLLGFAEDADRQAIQRLRATRISAPLRNPLDTEARTRLLLAPAAREPLGEVFAALAREISALIVQPALGANLAPAASDARLAAIAGEIAALYGVEAEVFVGDKVPGLAAVTAFPREVVVLDRSLLGESELTLRFLFGYAFEAIRGGYAILLQLGARHRRELGNLLRALLAPDGEPGDVTELLGSVPAHGQQVLARHAGLRDVDPGAWIDGMLACAKRAGLVACDDFHAAIWTVALLAGEKLSSHHATVALGSVLGGPDLVRFYLSDNYQQVRDLLTV